jgi:hypothetical protein
MAVNLLAVCVDNIPTLKREKIRIGNGEKNSPLPQFEHIVKC